MGTSRASCDLIYNTFMNEMSNGKTMSNKEMKEMMKK